MYEALDRKFVTLPEIAAEEFLANGGISRYFAAREPVLIRGLTHDWDFARRWSDEYLETAFGDFTCTIVQDSRPDLATERRSLASYLRGARDGVNMMTIVGLGDDADERPIRDLPFPNPLFAREHLSAFFFFSAPTGGGSLPHCHQDAFNLLQRGAKRWLLWDADPVASPQGWEHLRDVLDLYGSGSHARDWFVDGADSLAAAGVEAWTAQQEAGDVVYVPARYAHAAVNLSDTLGIVPVVDRPGSVYRRGPDGRYILPGRAG